MAIVSRIARACRLGLAAASLLFISLIATTAAAQTRPTITTLVSAPNPSQPGDQVTIVASVRAPIVNFDDSPGAGHVALGYGHSCALAAGGTVTCWGYNGIGELGTGSAGFISNPIEVPGLTGVVSLAAGYEHSCALLDDGTVRCWGWNGNSQLGYETPLGYSPTPKIVPGLEGVIALALGAYHSCALLNDDSVKCWGYNYHGQLGDGTQTQTLTPTTVLNLGGVTAIAAGYGHSCALLGNKSVKCWGYNSNGELGDGTQEWRFTPVDVLELTDVTGLSLGGDHSCATVIGGKVKCWGYNGYGQLGYDTQFGFSSVPGEVQGLADATDAAAGFYHSCALVSGGTLKCWGYNYYGQLGNGTSESFHLNPSDVASITGATSLAAGYLHTCAAIEGGALKCWGWDYYGQLGDAGYFGYYYLGSKLLPVSVSDPATGDVTLFDGDTPIDSGVLSSDAYLEGTRTLYTTNLAAGTHLLKAVYTGNSAFDTSESTVLTHIVGDAIAPQIQVPAPITQSTDPGKDFAVVTYQVSATDNTDSDVTLTRTSGPASGAEFPLGQTLVAYTATDDAGNEATASFTVTVEDGEAPEITVPADINIGVASGLTSAIVTYDVSATDNVGVVSFTRESGFASGEEFPLGDTPVTYMASDAAGNTSTASFTVTVTQTVTDHVPPVVTVPGNITVSNDPCSNSAIVNYSTPTAIDDVDGPVTPYLSGGLPSGSAFPVGVTPVTWLATDASGNTGSATFTVTVNKQTAATDDDDVLTGTDASETMYGLRGDDTLCALGGNDKLYGGPGNDDLDGSSGADDMNGEEGDDTYVVDNTADRVFERSHRGWDRVHSSVNFQLSHNVEELQLEGSEPINGYGNEKANRLVGNSAKNRLYGSGGDDLIEGMGEADFMDGGSGDDTLSYGLSGSPVTIDLAKEEGFGGDAEGDKFDRFQNVIGSPGDDTLLGDKWVNHITGGRGADTLTGRDGKDDFVYWDVNESPPGAPDTITDFSKGDEVDVEAIDANPATPLVDEAFKFIGSAPFTVNRPGELRFENGVLFAETTGDGVADMAIKLLNVNSLKVSQIDL